MPRWNSEVPTLSPHQTFWEKVLALHDARSRFLQRARLPRLRGRHLSRHYYDVAMISAHPVSGLVLDHPETLLRVRDHAQANSWKDYSSAEPGTLALIPPHTEGTASAPPSFLAFLEEDYRQMRRFIFGDAPSFDWIVSRLETIEATVNRTLSHERTYARDLGMSF
ncbi:MAG: nucleotidyl transferase AbiEii/AbiGii toxin family protein [Gammaproteobacteria bacterium]|nr:nucleotidyl transferase AbiEii/AbiGii toxin family protein [Gammaproteobacteria bacterium]